MAGYAKSIVPIIEAKYESFTQVEKSIADFFLNNREEMDFSAKSISERLFVSVAALSRFAQKCGFQGYREFIYQYKAGILEPGSTELIRGNVRKVLNIYQEILNKTYNLVDEAQIVRIIGYINQSEQVFVCGKGSSGLAANEMEGRFMRIGVNIDSQQDTDRIRMCTVFQDKNKLVIGLSLSGETEEILYLLRESYKRGARTVLITASDKESFRKFCTEVVLVPSMKHMNSGNVISPQFSILVIIDVLYYYYVNEDKQGKELLHDNTLLALNEGKKQRFRMIE